MLGPDPRDPKEVRVLNRILTWSEEGIKYEADPRYVEIALKELKLENAKTVSTSGTREEGRTKTNNEEELSSEEASQYRGPTARLNFLAADRPDIAYAVKELARTMSKPLGPYEAHGSVSGGPAASGVALQVATTILHSCSVQRRGLGRMQDHKKIHVRWMCGLWAPPHQGLEQNPEPDCPELRRK